jgi:hypothetical protein
LKTLLSLLLKDFKRDFKRPWSILLFASLPVIMTGIMALVFGGRRESVSVPTIHVAILDQDKDLLPHMLRYLAARDDAAEKLQLHFVENRDEGLHLLEKRKVSALVVLPEKMTERLLKGQVNAIELYENPADQYLPKVVRHGVSLLTVGLSSVAEVLQAESSGKPRADGSHNRLALVQASLRFLQTLRHSLIDFETVPPTEYRLQATNAPKVSPPP